MSVLKSIPTKDSLREQREAEQQAAAFAAARPSREARRKAAHRGLAECEAASQECVALRAELARIQGEMDAAADAHVQTCAPIQAELQTICDHSVTRVLAGQPAVDAREDRRRSELLSELSAANATLEQTLRDLKAQARPIEIRAAEAGMRAAKRSNYTSELRDTADPQLWAESQVAARTFELAKQRLDVALERSRQYPADAMWQLELTTAAMLHDQATRESDEAFQALLDAE
jgi:hypothetical protein